MATRVAESIVNNSPEAIDGILEEMEGRLSGVLSEQGEDHELGSGSSDAEPSSGIDGATEEQGSGI